ncbi:hypothetical protein Tam10B_0620 [Bifidobacterium vansinderenii]|uniref:Uncharacterized protein n=1 Tax=Bifidobacterium vansinderenii TaxID=1984871 RepID=A0A229VZK2_9BIFI|nr:hypothetical protein Tam10B_0620 [Bifidobacterium vansinderenii]
MNIARCKVDKPRKQRYDQGFDFNDALEGPMASYVEYPTPDTGTKDNSKKCSDNGSSHHRMLPVYQGMLEAYCETRRQCRTLRASTRHLSPATRSASSSTADAIRIDLSRAGKIGGNTISCPSNSYLDSLKPSRGSVRRHGEKSATTGKSLQTSRRNPLKRHARPSGPRTKAPFGERNKKHNSIKSAPMMP